LIQTFPSPYPGAALSKKTISTSHRRLRADLLQAQSDAKILRMRQSRQWVLYCVKGAIVDMIATTPTSGPAISSPAVEDPIIDMIAVHKAELAGLTATDDPREIFDGVDRADMILRRLLTTPPRSFRGASLLLQHLAQPVYEDYPDTNSILADAQSSDGKLKEAADRFLASLGAAVGKIATAVA
jgi:hypothetical protein